MSKYAPLGEFLRHQIAGHVPMTFAEIERILGFALPRSRCYPAWWSNNETNNVMTKVWLDAGYRTEAVDIEAETLVFRRGAASGIRSEIKRDQPDHDDLKVKNEPRRHPLFGRLAGLIMVPEGTDLTAPADEEWGERL